MNSFGKYLQNSREQLGLPLRKVTSELYVNTSILRKIERNERGTTKEILPMLAKTIDIEDRIMQLEFIQSTALIGLCYFNFFCR